MKNSQTPLTLGHQIPARYQWVRPCIHILFALLLILAPILLARGQNSDGAITISGVASHPTQNGTVVRITADSSLSRAQTWQDKEGFHVIVPDSGLSDLVKSGNGVRVRRLGSVIEILVLTKPGTPVGVQTYDNNLQLTIDGKIDSARTDSDSAVSQDQSSGQVTSSSDYSGQSYSNSASSYSTGSSYPAETTSPSAAGQNSSAQSSAAQDGQGQVRDAGEYQSKEEGNITEDVAEEEGVLASIFSGTSVAVVLVLAMVALLVIRKLRSKGELTTQKVDSRAVVEESTSSERNDSGAQSFDPQGSSGALVRSDRAVPANGSSRERNAVARPVVNAPASLYGAYRIDQEVGKLVLGQAHRMDVLSSRATDDRRAIEASLIKAISSVSSDDERRRAREALQEYGFVARQSAALLLAPDAFERTSAARSLGEIGSTTALPFLLEALYDVESIVRNQAVVSIGELKVPSAIGALLDMAQKHPDVPSSLVSRALSACSVDGLGFFDAVVVPATSFLTSGTQDSAGFGFTHLEPASSVEELPESTDDEGFAEALAKVTSENVDERIESVKSLAQFPVKSSVAALISLTQHDPESTVRALAVSSLAFIDHESVFPQVLIGMADESREVRAAAARALSRLSFDRSEAYVTVIQTGDEETLGNVAQACIKAGIVSQNLDRLASGDRRQAYEAFSLICLLAKAQMTHPILDAIANHSNVDVRLNAVQLLAATGEEYLFDQLQLLAVSDEIDEEVKTALLEAMYKLEEAKPKEEAPVDEFVIKESEEAETFETVETVETFETFETRETTDQPEMGLDFDVGTHVNEVES